MEHLKQTYSRYTTRRAAPSVHPAADPPSALEDVRERGAGDDFTPGVSSFLCTVPDLHAP